jgi:hypothetical protein
MEELYDAEGFSVGLAEEFWRREDIDKGLRQPGPSVRRHRSPGSRDAMRAWVEGHSHAPLGSPVDKVLLRNTADGRRHETASVDGGRGTRAATEKKPPCPSVAAANKTIPQLTGARGGGGAPSKAPILRKLIIPEPSLTRSLGPPTPSGSATTLSRTSQLTTAAMKARAPMQGVTGTKTATQQRKPRGTPTKSSSQPAVS